MSFFVDVNVPAYAALASARKDACARVLQAVADGAAGRMSTAAVEELWHLELSGRLGAKAGLAARAAALFSPLIAVSEAILLAALDLEAPAALGANDRVHVATCHAIGIDTIVTADAAFDAVSGLTRVDPLDEAAVAALLN